MNAHAFGVAGLLALVLAGCSNHAGMDANAATQSSTDQMHRSSAVSALVHDYEQARAARQWDLALSYADRLQTLAPDSAMAAQVKATLADTSTHAEEARDKAQLARLWSYNVVIAAGADGTDDVFTTATIAADGSAEAEGVQPHLVLRRHPKLGHGLNVVLDQGDFDCAGTCSVAVQFDDQPARPFAATRAAMSGRTLSISDEQAIRQALGKVRVLTIGASVDGKPRKLSFPVGGFDSSQLERSLQ